MEEEIAKFINWLESKELEICRFDGKEFTNESLLLIRENYFKENKNSRQKLFTEK